MASAERQARSVLERLENDPGLARDIARWIDASDAVGGMPIIAYRDSFEGERARDAEQLIPVRQVGTGKNRLFHADNLAVLESLLDAGERFRCVYIDPPFGTRQQFVRKKTNSAAYCDAVNGGEYLGALRQRLVLLRELLADDGSLFLHLDSSMVAEAKVILDELFGRSNFRSWITRRKCSSKNFTRKSFGDVTDFILFYSKTKSYVWNRPYEPRTHEQERIDFPKVDPETGDRFALVPIHAPGTRNGATGERWRGMYPPKGKHWQWTPKKLDEFDAAGDIYWTRNGTPRRKIWAADSPGTGMTNLLAHYRDPFNQNFSTTGYPTEKNQDLIKCLVEAATNPGDAVLDCFCGSGTTLHAAAESSRSWVGVDKGNLAVALTQRRLIAAALDPDRRDRDAFGFEFWAPQQSADAIPAADYDDIEFAIQERWTSRGLFEVTGLIEAGPSLKATLGSSTFGRSRARRMVIFDHSGHMVDRPSYEPSQASETRPA
jgi:adenine-specific DNA-methyltransferase